MCGGSARGEGEGASERAVAMAEQHKEESVLEKLSDKLHGRGGGSSSSSSDSDDERSSATTAVKAKIYRLFGREKPVHSVLGGGKRKPGPQRSSPISARGFFLAVWFVDPTTLGFASLVERRWTVDLWPHLFFFAEKFFSEISLACGKRLNSRSAVAWVKFMRHCLRCEYVIRLLSAL